MDAPRVSVTPIEELNALPADELAPALRPLFEAAAPLATRLDAARPFTSYDELLDKAADIVFALPKSRQVGVVNAHPRIGADPNTVSGASYHEQGYANERGEDLASVYADLARLNKTYEDKFGFRFVVFVHGRSKAEVLEVLRERINGDADDELRTALQAILDIARARYHAA
jgi:OHCU decarboxylase